MINMINEMEQIYLYKRFFMVSKCSIYEYIIYILLSTSRLVVSNLYVLNIHYVI